MVGEIRRTERAALQRWVVGSTVMRVRLRGLDSRRVFFLYQRPGVKNRIGAALVAAEVLGPR